VLGLAIHYIESTRTHFHKTKSSLTVSSGGDRLKDETKVEFVDDLNECLKEVQKRGNYFGKFSLTIVIYDRDRAKVERTVSDFVKAFSKCERISLLRNIQSAIGILLSSRRTSTKSER
jgi:hypothetical protein